MTIRFIVPIYVMSVIAACSRKNSTLPDAGTAIIQTSVDSIAETTSVEIPDEIICCFPCEPIPRFPGGEQALVDFLEKNIQYPEAALRAEKSGTVFVTFGVNADGKLSDIGTAGSSPGFGMDEEALRVVKMMPDWETGVLKGKPSVTRFSLPIRFSLADEKK
ncbi:energy transducer TonB [Chitinophaga rhizosphaerae]|uniref:energy transducer TonB n=1 Tax=Chitinophaga rhizosphaerae TaxID=1864947 RepID=UPI0013E037F0|nr:energy transducer TonB [Chitinophaga rhizosphaerae]